MEHLTLLLIFGIECIVCNTLFVHAYHFIINAPHASNSIFKGGGGGGGGEQLAHIPSRAQSQDILGKMVKDVVVLDISKIMPSYKSQRSPTCQNRQRLIYNFITLLI